MKDYGIVFSNKEGIGMTNRNVKRVNGISGITGVGNVEWANGERFCLIHLTRDKNGKSKPNPSSQLLLLLLIRIYSYMYSLMRNGTC